MGLVNEGFRHDIFVSYKQKRFFRNAKWVSDFCQDIGLRTWIDQEQIRQNVILPREEMQALLKEAVLASRLVILFETYDAAERELSSGEASTAFNWQIHEQQYAKEILIVVPSQTGLSYITSCEHQRICFYNWPYLAYLLGVVVNAETSKLDAFWDSHFAMFPLATQVAYQVHKLHDRSLFPELPEILDPRCPQARRNVADWWHIKGRKDVSDNNRFIVR